VKDLVIVTGASSGLGSATAKRLLHEGFSVVGIARRPVDPAATFGEHYTHVRADLSELEALPGLVRTILADHGPPFGLVNNAAVGLDGLLPTMHNSEIARVLNLDLLSPIVLTKYVSRQMLSHRRGRIVNVSSIVARTGFRGLSVYAAAKAGLEGFTRSLARDLGPRGITVNCVAAGFVDTEMTRGLNDADLVRIKNRSPLARFATLEEVAGAITYLLSADASGVTGTVVTVDAGTSA
jgi:3-oxoacyl-[acyl-carrier protein] reductase